MDLQQVVDMKPSGIADIQYYGQKSLGLKKTFSLWAVIYLDMVL